MEATGSPEPAQTFISYSHRDEKYLNEVKSGLIVLERQKLIALWSDHQIIPGQNLDEKIALQLQRADLILLLVSNYFFESDYIYGIELTHALERDHARTARVIPIIARPCEWTSTPIGKLKTLPRDGKPVMKWRPQADAYNDIAQGIRAAVQDLAEVKRAAARLGGVAARDGLEPLVAAFQAAYSSDDLNQMVFYRLNRKLTAHEVDATVRAAKEGGWLPDLVREAAEFRPESRELKAFAAVGVVSGNAATQPPPDSPAPDPAALSWATLAARIFGAGNDETTERIVRGFKNDAYRMVYDQLPITGDFASTRRIVLGDLDIVYLQGKDSVVKLIRFVVPLGAKQLRVPSNRRIDVSGHPFTPPTWVFIEDGAVFRECRKASAIALPAEERWLLGAGDAGKSLYSVTWYETEHFFPIAGRGDNTGAVIGDLAGRVERLNFLVGGHFRDVRFQGFYNFGPTHPLTFSPCNIGQVVDLANPGEFSAARFGRLLDSLGQRVAEGGTDSPAFQAVVTVWADVRARAGGWAAATLEGVRNDVMVHLEGAFGGNPPPG